MDKVVEDLLNISVYNYKDMAINFRDVDLSEEMDILFNHAPELAFIVKKFIGELPSEKIEKYKTLLNSNTNESKKIYLNVFENDDFGNTNYVIQSILQNYQFDHFILKKRLLMLPAKSLVSYFSENLSKSNFIIFVKQFDNNYNLLYEFYLEHQKFRNLDLLKKVVSLIYSSFSFSVVEDEYFKEMFRFVGTDFYQIIGGERKSKLIDFESIGNTNIPYSNVYIDSFYRGAFKKDDLLQIVSQSPSHYLFYTKKYNVPDKSSFIEDLKKYNSNNLQFLKAIEKYF